MTDQLLKAFMEGYNGEKDNYLWSSNCAEAYFVGELCKSVGFDPVTSIVKSRGSSYKLNGSKTPVTIQYSGRDMRCDIQTIFNRPFFAAA